ncbi:MAG TPA: hypothetical protein VNZ50_08350 [Hyphomicrobiaceae bacterium]|jgi:hypothetical protein|nr:hypothetical protein [Hyphomicrobiaceae bacterium]
MEHSGGDYIECRREEDRTQAFDTAEGQNNTFDICQMSDRFYQLINLFESTSCSIDQPSRPIDEAEIQRSLDNLTERLYEICGQLSTLHARSVDHLRLKASALKFLLPQDACLEIALANSLIGDFDAVRFGGHPA